MDRDPYSDEQLRFERKLDYPYNFDHARDPIAMEIIAIILGIAFAVLMYF